MSATRVISASAYNKYLTLLFISCSDSGILESLKIMRSEARKMAEQLRALATLPFYSGLVPGTL